MELPPPVIGRVPTMLTTDDCIYATAVEGKILDLKVTAYSLLSRVHQILTRVLFDFSVFWLPRVQRRRPNDSLGLIVQEGLL